MFLRLRGFEPEKSGRKALAQEASQNGRKSVASAAVRVLYQEDQNSIIGQYIIFLYNEQRKYIMNGDRNTVRQRK